MPLLYDKTTAHNKLRRSRWTGQDADQELDPLNHMIHHRGQLPVYLPLQDVPLHRIYGPTADES